MLSGTFTRKEIGYLIVDIEDELFFSKSKIKYVIKNMGILPIYRGKRNELYYSSEQVELIKENDFRNYSKNDGFVLYKSKINFNN